MKQSFTKLSVLVIAMMLALGGCKEKVEVLPLPDFAKLLVEVGTFKGGRVNEVDLALYRETEVKVTQGATADELIFTESFTELGLPTSVQYKVLLGKGASNAVKLVIPSQSVGTQTYVGLVWDEKSTDTAQGYYEAYDSKTKARIDNLYYRISVRNANGVTNRWSITLKKK